jgi:two-component system chemotaxis response regulator CheY
MPKILLIDDSRFSRSMLKQALGNEYEYAEAENGLLGLEQYFIFQPDLVLLDLTMPEMNGLEVLARLRQLDPQSKVLICTADIQFSSREQALALGAAGFISKPVVAAELQAAVKKALTGGA